MRRWVSGGAESAPVAHDPIHLQRFMVPPVGAAEPTRKNTALWSDPWSKDPWSKVPEVTVNIIFHDPVTQSKSISEVELSSI